MIWHVIKHIILDLDILNLENLDFVSVGKFMKSWIQWSQILHAKSDDNIWDCPLLFCGFCLKPLDHDNTLSPKRHLFLKKKPQQKKWYPGYPSKERLLWAYDEVYEDIDGSKWDKQAGCESLVWGLPTLNCIDCNYWEFIIDQICRLWNILKPKITIYHGHMKIIIDREAREIM